MQKNIDDLMTDISEAGFEILPIKPQHLLTLSQLKFIHKDPFDRLIIPDSGV